MRFENRNESRGDEQTGPDVSRRTRGAGAKTRNGATGRWGRDVGQSDGGPQGSRAGRPGAVPQGFSRPNQPGTGQRNPSGAGRSGAASASISVRQLTRVYEVPGRKDARVLALDGVDADFPEGSFTAIVGASGSGKSTLLHCMAGLDEPTDGRVTMLGSATSEMKPAKRATFRAQHVGFVFQEYNLIASLTAAENVSMPSRFAGRTLSKGQIDAALDAVGLRRRANLKPHQLSGGERQRVAIARVMASEPRIVFADEPTGALDLDSSGIVLDWLRQLASRGTTVVMVTHDVEAAALADSVAVMSGGRLATWSNCRDAQRIADLVHAARAR